MTKSIRNQKSLSLEWVRNGNLWHSVLRVITSSHSPGNKKNGILLFQGDKGQCWQSSWKFSWDSLKVRELQKE